MTDLVHTFLFGTLILVRNFSRTTQIIVGVILIILAILRLGAVFLISR